MPFLPKQALYTLKIMGLKDAFSSFFKFIYHNFDYNHWIQWFKVLRNSKYLGSKPSRSIDHSVFILLKFAVFWEIFFLLLSESQLFSLSYLRVATWAYLGVSLDASHLVNYFSNILSLKWAWTSSVLKSSYGREIF